MPPPLPISRTAVDKLGKRLASEERVSDEDLPLLLEVLGAYQDALDVAQVRLNNLGYRPTGRTKTTGVLIDKLRREHSSLKSVQDIAGTRIICEDRDEQDDIVAAIVEAFADGARPPKVRDRRDDPSHGYRAVHVIVTVDDLPVEIQVRTERQDRWAQIVESLGDRWGRGIRYGEPPPNPDLPIVEGVTITRGQLWAIVQGLAERTNSVERWQTAVARLLRALALSAAGDENLVLNQEAEEIKADLAVAEVELSRDLATFVSVAENLGGGGG